MDDKRELPFFKPIKDEDDEIVPEDIPDYDEIGNIEDVTTEPTENLDEIHQQIDQIPTLSHQKQLFPRPELEENDEPILPEQMGTVLTKYRVEAEVPKAQRKDFEINRSFHGRHVALSNTRRMDNLRHLDAQDLCNIFDRIPTMRHQATLIRMRETAEFQMCRSNPEIGGFEAKIGLTNIRREDVDVRQSQSLFNGNKKKEKKSLFGFLKGGN